MWPMRNDHPTCRPNLSILPEATIKQKLRVKSGGQTGVDQAALAAAKTNGYPTGGWLPFGCVTLDGLCPELVDLYGMVICEEPGYQPRTFRNVRDSDATLIIANKISSPGERCTRAAIAQYNKPVYIVQFKKEIDKEEENKVVEFITNLGLCDLNIAGNSETTSPGIYNIAYRFLDTIFKRLA